MAVPTEAPGDVMTSHGLVAGDNVLDGPSQDVAIVREAGGEGRSIVEYVLRLVLGAFQLSLEGVNLGPELKNPFLLVRKREILALTHIFHG